MSNLSVISFLNEKSIKRFKDSNISREGFTRAFNLFSKAAKRVPAYKDFLSKNKINPKDINNLGDFNKIPFTTKENYILKYDLKDRCWDSKVDSLHTLAASSGTTGEPVFWPRELEQEIEGARIHEYLLDKVFMVSKKKTLFINSFGLGNWIAGMYTEFCIYLLKLKGLQFTLASPGYNQEETFKIVRNFSKYYDQTIIACHPPVLKMMIENGLNQGIEWKKLNIKFFGAAEGFSENWRDYLLSQVGQSDPLTSFINIYGSADAGLMGFESPLSILVHRLTSKDHEYNKKLFNNDRTPYLYQFDPRFKYLETNDQGEIMITCNASAPLLKYNIHDQGGILDFSVVNKNKDISQVYKKDWVLPFVYVYGRDKFMTSLYGVNIYPENIKSVLDHKSLQPYLTGRFVTDKKTDKFEDMRLILFVELKEGVNGSKRLSNFIKNIFIQVLKELNSEYSQVESKFRQKIHPEVVLLKYHDEIYFPEGKVKKMS